MTSHHRYRLYQFSIRALLLLTTLVAIAAALYSRSREFGRQVLIHRSCLPPEAELKRERAWRQMFRDKQLLTPLGESELDNTEAWVRFHEESAEAYERASRRPWLPVSLPVAPPDLLDKGE